MKPLLSVGCAVVLGLLLIGLVIWQVKKSGPASTGAPARPPAASREEAALLRAELVNFSWSTGGLEPITLANFTVANYNEFAIKDITIECQQAGKSGIQIDSNTCTIHDIIPPKAKKTFRDFNMGFTHTQAVSSGCGIKSIKLAE